MARQVQMPQNWFIGSKLVPPFPHAGIIARSLVSRILNPQASTVLLNAPAGFGKTTLLSQAFETFRREGGRSVWLTLDQDDADPKTFLAYLVAAMVHQGMDVGDLDAHAQKGFAAIAFKAGMAMTANCLNALVEPTIFFLDDLHLSDTDEMLSALTTLIGQASNTTRFVIATRRTPRLGLAKLMSSGRLETLESADLRFNEEEGRTLLSAYADPGDIGAILARTQGWPVMIQLMKLSMHHHKFRWRDMLIFSGRTTELANYLSEQIAEGMSKDLLHVLMRIAICDRFNGDLLNHLCDRRDGWMLVDTCVNQGLLITPLDAEGHWYRFHPLFREFLAERLRRDDPGAVPPLHSSAARWFHETGLPREAIRHAHHAGDTELVIQILAAAGGWLVTLRGGPALMRIIADLPQEVLTNDPTLRFGHVYLLIQDGDFPAARQMLDELIGSVDIGSFKTPEAYSFFKLSAGALDALLHGYEGDYVDPEHLSKLRDECSVRIEPILDALITHLIGYFQHNEGLLRLARKTGRLAIQQCHDAEADFVEAYAHLCVGRTYLELGELDDAQISFETAVELADKNFGPDSGQAIAGRVFRSELAYERGDTQGAWALLAPELDRIALHDQWFIVYASAYRVGSGICLRDQGYVAATTFLNDVLARLDKRQRRIVFPYVNALKAEIFTLGGKPGSASEILEPGAALPKPDHRSPADACAALRLEMALGNVEHATSQISELSNRLKESGHARWLIKVTVLQAICHYQLRELKTSSDFLKKALTMASETGLWGPIAQEMSFMEAFWANPNIVALLDPDKISSALGRRGSAPRTSFGAAQANAIPHLGRREQEILALLTEGLTSKEIARVTDLAIGTILSYRKSIYRKLSVNSRSAAIAAGRNLGRI